MSANDEVRVDIHENENTETSPQEHDNVMDTTIALQNQSSKEEIVENRTSPQDQAVSIDEVRINIAHENEEHGKMDELVTSPPPKRIGESKNELSDEIVENETSVLHEDQLGESKNESSDEIVENDTSVLHEDQLDGSKNGSFEEIKEHVTSLPNEDQADYWKRNQDLSILYRAALNNDWNMVYRDIFKGDPLKYSNYFTAPTTAYGDTLLHNATVANSILFVKELVNYMTKDQLTTKASYGNTAFFYAAFYGWVEVAKVMFEKNKLLPSIRGKRGREMLPIHVAAQNGCKEMVEFLYKIQGPLEEIDSNGLFLNVMNRVSLFGDSRIYDRLNKLYIAASTNNWNTAHRDVFEGDVSKNSKYLTARISEGEYTALHVAVSKNSSTFVEELIKHMRKEDLAIKSGCGCTAFIIAAESGRVKLAKKMFEKNADLPNIRGCTEMLPIYVAAEKGHKLMVEFLYGIQGPLEEKDRNKLSDYLKRIQDQDMSILHTFAWNNDWNTAYRDIFKKDPLKYSNYFQCSDNSILEHPSP